MILGGEGFFRFVLVFEALRVAEKYNKYGVTRLITLYQNAFGTAAGAASTHGQS